MSKLLTYDGLDVAEVEGRGSASRLHDLGRLLGLVHHLLDLLAQRAHLALLQELLQLLTNHKKNNRSDAQRPHLALLQELLQLLTNRKKNTDLFTPIGSHV